MLKGILFGVTLTMGIVLIGGCFLVNSGLIPANADAKPGRLETWVAKTSLKEQNPVALTDQNLLGQMDRK
ncbi:hypothetical protein [Ferrovum myxofaciens]|uniref:Uncharacterized protein n=1 Tax=Ferrovum myxofaciens TaxID=416213 RepID=A0A9E6SX10_9PROT|nr:hypothetical protein [Ferrovum myxofaciens]QSH81858.1 MAG: hypothetical protein HO273_13950 [Ferrovum myxofaciens]QWY76914.1 MAG: hypothetical protein JZL65_10540 [Ferrovum myxofaciens]